MGTEDGIRRLVAVLRSLHDGDVAAARDRLAGVDPGDSLLAPSLRTYLADTDPLSDSVYTQPAAFEAFIRGGGNVGLYRAVSTALARQYEEFGVRRLLDIGCGDGSAVLPALVAAGPAPTTVDLVEPSAVLLQRLGRRASEEGVVGLHPWELDARSFLVGPGHQGRWDLAESTFALHALPDADRLEVLLALQRRVRRLALVEFDVPAVEPGSEAHLAGLVTSYEIGLAEYSDDPMVGSLVAQGFLMPVLVGQLRPGAVRSTWEQPAPDWKIQVESAGFSGVTVRPLAPYWSSPAFLLTAQA